MFDLAFGRVFTHMTKELVKFVLGSPVIVDSFDNDTWNYIYRFKSGRSKTLDTQKRFTVKFVDNKLFSADGDFELSDNFTTPFNTPIQTDNSGS
jgi:outer membrane protein assembly factor BamE